MVVYNGNLGKDLAYPAMNATITRVYDITGDVIILNKDDSSYLGSKVQMEATHGILILKGS